MEYRATLALANHRLETIEPAKQLMERHEAVILEEPADAEFERMLTGQLDVESYLEGLDREYPEFGRRMSGVLRELHEAGTRLYQVEPYLERLAEIHERFESGGSPAEWRSGSELDAVYGAERAATAALIDFYQIAIGGSFDETVAAVKHFARADARRFALRDQMRAAAIAEILAEPGSYCVEAGQIHYPLWQELKRKLPADYSLDIRFVMVEAVDALGHRGHLYGPGDVLTLRYWFRPGHSHPKNDLLAARALIYNRLIEKNELLDTTEPYPHTRNELETSAIVRRLALDDCRRLYPVVRRASTAEAWDRVRRHVGDGSRGE